MQLAIGFVLGAGLCLGAWTWAWQRQWWPRHLRQVGDIVSLKQQIETLERDHTTDSRAFDLCEVRRVEATKRAELAEGIARGQARHIDALESSNAKLLDSVIEMRRVGFSLPSDILNSPDPEVITTVADDDLQAVKTYPHLAAADED